LSQPDLLLQIVLLYCQTEQQLAGDLAQQAVQLDAVLLVDIPQQQQGLGAAGGSSSSNGRAVALAAAAAQLPVPNSILHAVEKLGRSLPNGLHPEHTAAQWIVAHSGQLQGATRVLLQRWLAALLPACANSSTDSAAAAAGSGSSGALGTGQMQQGMSAVDAPVVQQQQQEGCAALVGLLLKFPGALQVAVQLARSCLEAKQQQQQQQQQQLQLAGWLCILTATLHSLGSSTSGNSSSSGGCDPSEWEYLSYVSLQGTGSDANAGSISSSSVRLQQLLLGPAGVLELCKRSLLAAAGSAGSSWGSSLVVLACNSCLLAAVNAAAAAAAAAANDGAGIGDGSYAVRQQLEQQLLQYGIQQVRPYRTFRVMFVHTCFACCTIQICARRMQLLGQ
jgi:hypothetical protein